MIGAGEHDQIGAVGRARAFESGAQAVPDFLLRIALAAEQDVLAVRSSGNEHGDRFRFGEMG